MYERELELVGVFDEIWLDRLVEAGRLTKAQKRQLLLAAMNVEPREGRCEASFWKELCPSLPNSVCDMFASVDLRHMTTHQIDASVSKSKMTSKLVLKLQDGHTIETCLILKGSMDDPRATVCVSCQIGCQMGCIFCATGTMDFKGNLTAGEILEQFVRCLWIERRRLPTAYDHKYIDNVVFMGMGEPMANYDNVVAAVRQLRDIHAVAGHRITVSTVGCSPAKIIKLKQDAPTVSLALSLHAPTRELRNEIVPSSANVSLDRLLMACELFVDNQRQMSNKKAKRQCLLVEYCMIMGLNDKPKHVEELISLLSFMREKVIINLIPYNPTDVKSKFQPPQQSDIEHFAECLREAGFKTYIREECGQDIAAACGQLALKSMKANFDWNLALTTAAAAAGGLAVGFLAYRLWRRRRQA